MFDYFSAPLSSLENKILAMEKIMEDYAAFEWAMDEDKVYLDLCFEEICEAIGAEKNALDRLILSEIGVDGNDLVDFYRSKFG